MASLAKVYSKEKLTGQIFTPDHIVRKILDDVGYEGAKILGKSILDPSCGDGRFLLAAARRVIAQSPPENLPQNLLMLHGWDIDRWAVASCKENLDLLIRPLGISVNWNVRVADALEQLPEQSLFSAGGAVPFDFIVGNPPYIRIQHLSVEQRAFIQSRFSFCKSGSTDIFIAFIELALRLLRDDGTAGFITPNTYFYTETGRALRQHFADRKNIRQITNFGDLQVFGDATTYSAITVFDTRPNSTFLFQKAKSVQDFEDTRLDFSVLKNAVWQLPAPQLGFVGGKRLGDIARIHVGVTTLCDKAYLVRLSEKAAPEGQVHVSSKLGGPFLIEPGILKPIIKASRLKSSEQPVEEYIIFPYSKNGGGKHQIIPEAVLAAQFPLAYRYLLSVKPALDRRDAGKPNPVAWYAFGRSQGLDTSFGPKILFSPMNLRPNFVYRSCEECTFYSGYCIKYDGDVGALLQQLNSSMMAQFAEASCRDFRGGWKAYNKKVIENFRVVV